MALEDRVMSLIAIGASISANCTSCLHHHVKLARANGADEEEIQEAIDIALAVRRGFAAELDNVIATLVKK